MSCPSGVRLQAKNSEHSCRLRATSRLIEKKGKREGEAPIRPHPLDDGTSPWLRLCRLEGATRAPINGAGNGNRTRVSALARLRNSHYTIPAETRKNAPSGTFYRVVFTDAIVNLRRTSEGLIYEKSNFAAVKYPIIPATSVFSPIGMCGSTYAANKWLPSPVELGICISPSPYAVAAAT